MYNVVRLDRFGRKFFCDPCNKLFRANQKCDYCHQVYNDSAEDADMDGKDWIACDDCQKWNHADCESNNADDPYFCLSCRKKKKNKLLI